MGFGGGGTLSSLIIDVAKDWAGFKIQDLGNSAADMDAANQISVLTWLGHHIPTIYTYGVDRDHDVVYQATDPGARLVAIQADCSVSVVGANPHGTASLLLHVGSTVACGDFTFREGLATINLTNLTPGATNELGVEITLLGIIPHDYYYYLEVDVADDGVANVYTWVEFRPTN